MKTLIVQLARLGDIYLTWPVIRALKREYPNQEIHLLVRKRFEDACVGLEGVHRIHTLDSNEVLGPLLQDEVDIEGSLQKLNSWIENLQTEDFNRVINLSFSPASSFMTDMLSESGCEVRGYSRFSDGTLKISDDISAYFYAQVGPSRANRIHLSTLMAGVADVELTDEDWRVGENAAQVEPWPAPLLVAHLGASQTGKTYPTQQWATVFQELLAEVPHHILLIGSSSEIALGQQILNRVSSDRVHNWIGQTKVQDLFSIIREADLVIGGDSSPMHIATLVGTAALNLSFSTVNFFETGPLSRFSRVLYSDHPEDLDPAIVAAEAVSILRNQKPQAASAWVEKSGGGYKVSESPSFEWQLIEALYFGKDFPWVDQSHLIQAVNRLMEVHQLALEQFVLIQEKKAESTALEILNRVDEMTATIAHLVPEVLPIVRWFQTEKIKIGPGSFEEVLLRTHHAHLKLVEVLDYIQRFKILKITHGEIHSEN